MQRFRSYDPGSGIYLGYAWLTFRAAVVTDPSGAIVGLTPFGGAIFGGPALIILVLGTLGLAMFISFRIQRLSPSTAVILFMAYAALLGLMLSSVLLAYTRASVTRVLFISAASFGALSLYGYTTQRDLSGFGSFLVMGLFGLLVAIVVNLFLKSTGLDLAISAILSLRSSMCSHTVSRAPGSRPMVGSSRNSTVGRWGRLWAISNRRLMPPE
jgi:FtsH-binding integral membrane protein